MKYDNPGGELLLKRHRTKHVSSSVITHLQGDGDFWPLLLTLSQMFDMAYIAYSH